MINNKKIYLWVLKDNIRAGNFIRKTDFDKRKQA